MSAEEVRETLRVGIGLLRRDGFAQHEGGPTTRAATGRRCMLGAIFAAVDGAYEPYLNAFYAIEAHLNVGRGSYVSPMGWADARGRTATEVIELLEAAVVNDIAIRPAPKPIEGGA